MRRIVLLLSLVFAAGCVSTPAPTLTAIDDGTELAFQIQPARRNGTMTAVNPASGEKFEGRYTRVDRGQGMTVSNYSNAKGAPVLGGTSFHGPTSSSGSGVLRGDQGTVIELALEFAPTGKFRGHGTGTDNRGRRYLVQF